MSSDQVAIRYMQPGDKDFIMDSWIKGQYHGSPYWSQMPKQLFYIEASRLFQKILARASVRIAFLGDLDIAYVVYEGETLYWAYTKADYRNQGIIKLLTKDLTITTVTSSTLPGASITKRKKLTFNPFIKE